MLRINGKDSVEERIEKVEADVTELQNTGVDTTAREQIVELDAAKEAVIKDAEEEAIVDADTIPFTDTSDEDKTKKRTWGDLKSDLVSDLGVNDDTTGGEDKFLIAEVGKTLGAEIDALANRVNPLPFTNLFNGTYRSDCYPHTDGYIDAATGGTARTHMFEMDANRYYLVRKSTGNRFGIGLANAVYAGTDLPGLFVVRDDPKGEYVFFSGTYTHAYIYVDNASTDVPLEIYDVTNSYERINVKDYGAKGDGITDDTDALITANILARCGNGVLYFPSGTYMTKRALYLKSNMRVVGEKGATIKKVAAVTTTTTAAVAAGDISVTVADVTGFEVGMDIQIIKSDTSARDATPGVIRSIDTENKVIYFDSYYAETYNSTGATTSYDIGSSVTSSFAILRTNAVVEKGENISIENLTLDGNAQAGEPAEWSLSCIHIDPDDRGIHLKAQNTIKIIDCTIINSPADGISAQCDGIVEIEGCTIDTCARHGIHLGSSCTDATVFNNRIENCTLDGVFWCQDVYGARVISNYIKACGQGCAADTLGTPGYDSFISNNVFDDITGYGVHLGQWDGIVCHGNIFKNVNDTAIYAPSVSNAVISGNIIKDVAVASVTAINLNSSSNSNLVGNVVINPNGTTHTATSATNLTAAGNNFAVS